MSYPILLLAVLLLLSGCAQQATPEPPAPAAEEPPFRTPPMNFTRSPLPQPVQIPPPPPPNQSANQSGNQSPPSPPSPPPPPVYEGSRFGPFILVLDDVSVIPNSDEPCGIFSIKDASSDEVLDKKIICPGESVMWSGYRIFVVKVAAGYSGGGNWADVRIYG